MEGISRLRRPSTQVDDPLTREYIHAGLDLIEEALNYDPEAMRGGHPFLAWISQRKVVEVANERGNLGGRASSASLRDRWEPHAEFLWDLIDHIRARRPGRSFPERARAKIRALLLVRKPPQAIVRELGRDLQGGIFENEFFRLQLLGLAVAGTPRFRESAEMPDVSGLYEEIDARWLSIVEGFLDKYELVCRPGIKPEDLVQLGTALAEGLALRELADPTKSTRRTARLRLHSTGLLAFLFALTVPASSTDHSISIDQAVDAMTA